MNSLPLCLFNTESARGHYITPPTPKYKQLLLFLKIAPQSRGFYMEHASNIVYTGIVWLRPVVTVSVCLYECAWPCRQPPTWPWHTQADSNPPPSPCSLLPESPDPFFSGTDAEPGVSSHCFRQHFRSTGEGSPKQNMKQNTPLAAHVGALKGRAPVCAGSYVHPNTQTRVHSAEATLLCVVTLLLAMEKSLS